MGDGAEQSRIGALQASAAPLKELTAALLDWAETQNDLAHALWRLDERDSGTSNRYARLD
jgi:hypothetical protein